MWARRSCPSRRVGLAGLLLALSLLLASAATTARASGPLGGQQVTVAAVPATVQRAVTPVVNTVHAVRQTAQRSVAATTTVAEAPAAVQHTVTAVSSTVTRSAPSTSAKPTSSRKTPRHRRGSGGAVAKAAAIKTPAPAAKRFPPSGVTTAVAVVAAAESDAAAAPQSQSLAPRPPAPRTERAATVAPVDDPGPAPAAPSSAAAASSAGSSAGATALLTLLFLSAFAAPRLGALLRLPAAQAPMPPLLAIPERPG